MWFFCCALWRGGNGCEIALCQLQEAENVPTIPQVSLSMTAINLLSDKSRFWFSLCEFCLKKKKSTTANYPVQFISSQFEVEICMLKKTNKNPPNTIHNNNKSFFAPQRMWHRSLDILQLNPQIALRLWCWKQRLRCDVVHFANRGLSTWEALQWWGNSCTLIILWATVVLC